MQVTYLGDGSRASATSSPKTSVANLRPQSCEKRSGQTEALPCPVLIMYTEALGLDCYMQIHTSTQDRPTRTSFNTSLSPGFWKSYREVVAEPSSRNRKQGLNQFNGIWAEPQHDVPSVRTSHPGACWPPSGPGADHGSGRQACLMAAFADRGLFNLRWRGLISASSSSG